MGCGGGPGIWHDDYEYDDDVGLDRLMIVIVIVEMVRGEKQDLGWDGRFMRGRRRVDGWNCV